MPGAQHIRIRCNGVMGPVSNPFETFSYGFSLGTVPSADWDGEALAGICAAYHARADTGIADTAVLQEVAISLVGPTGVQVGDTERVTITTPGGRSSGTPFPPQIAYRVSIGDGLRGRSHRGGWYVPLPAMGISNKNDPRMAAGDATSAASSAALLITQLQATAAGRQFVIASGVLGNLPVSVVRVGRAYDTMRSRRTNLPEDYSTATL
jgi:hypothetical protein